jgi:hypothetical protein
MMSEHSGRIKSHHRHDRGKRGISAMVGLMLLIPSGHAACILQNEKAAFQAEALISKFMVAALACNYHVQYNKFMEQHRSDLQRAYDLITAHFAQRYGEDRGEIERDSYITDLANSFAQEGTRPHYCAESYLFVLHAANLFGLDDLARYA